MLAEASAVALLREAARDVAWRRLKSQLAVLIIWES
jgi:hypothetical protein